MPNPDLFDTLFHFGSQMCAAPAEVIFKEGEAAQGVYLLASGRVELSVANDGSLLRSHIAGRGAMLGLASTIARSSHVFTAVVLEPTLVAYVRSDELAKLMREHPTLGVDIVIVLSTQAAAMRRRWSKRLRERSTSDS